MRNFIYSLVIILTVLAGYVVFHKDESTVNRTIGAVNSIIDNVVPASSHESTMLFVGDIMLSRSVGTLMAKKDNYNFPFEKIIDTLKQADLVIANLENPVSARGIKVGSIYSFRADPKVIESLQYAGINIVNIANNHMWDYGRDAFSDTLEYLKMAGIDYVGGGSNFKEVNAGITKDVGESKVTFLGYTDLISPKVSATKTTAGVSYLDLTQMVADIKQAKSQSDIVVVSFHWGDEYKINHNLKQEYIAKMAIDAGASLIIGHHPHVRQEIEQYKDSWIAYSLGNFIFDQNFSYETTHGIVLEVIIKDKEIKSVNKKEIAISNEYQASLTDLK